MSMLLYTHKRGRGLNLNKFGQRKYPPIYWKLERKRKRHVFYSLIGLLTIIKRIVLRKRSILITKITYYLDLIIIEPLYFASREYLEREREREYGVSLICICGAVDRSIFDRLYRGVSLYIFKD